MAKVKIQPLADRVLIEAAPAEVKTASGIFIPDTAKEKPQQGTVIAVGKGKKRNLYVMRGNTISRKVLNESDLIKILQKYNYEFIMIVLAS